MKDLKYFPFILRIIMLFLIFNCNYQVYNPFTEGSTEKNSSKKNSSSSYSTSNLSFPYVKVVDTGVVGKFTSIAVNGLNIYICYCDYNNYDLKFAKLTDGGATWPIIKVVDSAGDVGYYTSIAVNGSNVYISYYDISYGDLKFAKSSDGGTTWPNIQTVDTGGAADVGMYSSIEVNGLNVYISYFDNTTKDLKFTRSTNGGVNWLAGDIKIVDSTGNSGIWSSMAIDGSNIYISYNYATGGELKCARSTNGGATWLPGDIITVDSGLVGIYTSIAVDGLNVYISYCDYSGGIGNNDLKFARSTDGGVTWSIIKTVDSPGDVGWYTSIVINGSNVYISYLDNTIANRDLKFARSTDGGVTWLPGDIKIIDSPGDVGWYTSLAINGSIIYISYNDVTNGSLKLARSVDGGVTW